MSGAVDWYDQNAPRVTERYESVQPETVHAWLLDLLPDRPALILDVGAGSGRDAAWLASSGHDVIAVEPSASMRKGAARLHPETEIRWMNDRLPGLEGVTASGLAFDFILLSAVWMHVPPAERARAFRKIAALLKPGSVLAMTLRHGPADPERRIYPVTLDEVLGLARDHGLVVERSGDDPDRLGRGEVHWTHIALRIPDDGTGALPLLRHIILSDNKSSTYKLALLRTFCRVADGSAGMARYQDDDYVTVPLGLVALVWLRLFKPLLSADLPQSPSNIGYARLGFVKEPFRKLEEVSHLDLRVGGAFSGDAAAALHGALRDAAATIATMPATYMTYPKGGPVFPTERQGRLRRPGLVRLDESYLFGFGEMRVPGHLWQTLRRFDVWIEPALIAEWTRLTKGYALSQGRPIDDTAIASAMKWDEPTRDVGLARDLALQLARRGDLRCVWTGDQLSEKQLDLDHCLPWSAWPCGDLWNLMPARREVNQKRKRALLPSEKILSSARDRILEWWSNAYFEGPELVRQRFWTEARASLPGLEGVETNPSDIFEALRLRRTRLKHDQQVPEWDAN